MFRLCDRQRDQQWSSNLSPSLFGSILIHTLVALALSFRQSSQTPQTTQAAKLTPIPIIVAEQSSKRSPLKASGQSKSRLKVKTVTPAPKTTLTLPQAKSELTNTTPNSAPKIEEFQPKIKPSSPATPKADSPPVLTSNQSNIKLPKIATSTKVDPKVDKLVQNDEEIKSPPSSIATKPRLNHPLNNNPRKALTSSQNKPLKPEISGQENNAVTPNLNNPESTQGKNTSPAINSQESTAGQADSKTATGNIPSELAQPLSISCEENCQPEYPSVLDGAEGSAGIQLTIDRDGKVIDAAIANPNVNPQLNQEALKAAEEMEFSSIDRDRATVRVNISFTVAGSDFEQQAKEEQEKREEQ